MTISIYPTPLDVNPNISGSMPNINLTASSIDFGFILRGLKSSHPARERDPALDFYYYCSQSDRLGNPEQGHLSFKDSFTISGSWLNVSIFSEPIEFNFEFGEDVAFVLGFINDEDGSLLEFGFEIEADFLFEIPKTAFIKWSKVGTMDFTRDKTNKAGQMPMEWAGTVTNILKLGGKVIVYGGNGVSILTPSTIYWGINTIHKVGLISRDAVAGNEFVHFFVDQTGRLYQYDSQLHRLGYEEFLKNMTNMVLSYDPRNKLLYICNGTTGYVYSPDTQSFGEGPVNITGIDYQNQTEYAVSPGTISIPSFEIWTDTQDMGYRNGKQIYELDFAIDVTETIEAAVRMRMNKAEAFTQTGWYTVDSRGQVFIPCFGYEFQFGLRSSVYSYFELDKITIKGDVNAY